eukprot:m.180377 g.180377  ORF g.180377 m.180377 type:complete len:359 (-) comp14988_c0_seq1:97-1173(-)
MRSDVKTIALSVGLVGCVALYGFGPSISRQGAVDTETRDTLQKTLKQVEKLSAGLDSLRADLNAKTAGALAGRAALVAGGASVSARTRRTEQPKNDKVETSATTIGGPWERGQSKQRPEETAECKAWLDGTGSVYYHDEAAKKHVYKGGYTAQYKQDKEIQRRFFHNRKGMTYMDIAANHYKSISNTYFMDRCLAWEGICVEPNPAYHPGLLQNRSCAMVPKCVSDTKETVTFTFPTNFWEAPLGGVAGGQFKNRRPDDSAYTDVTLECATVSELMDQAGVTHIDFLSLDVEGHEKKLLTGIDFERFTFDVILCESMCGDILKANGYAKIPMPDMPGSDKVFLRKNGPFGSMLPEVPV